MKRILREPLLHFLVLGGALFAVAGLVSRGDRAGRIVVSPGRIESLATAFSLTWQRPPTASELEGLIRDYVREEAAVREAVALGLDKDDVVIRRRLRQKLEFVSADVAARAEPTDQELRAFLEAHPGDFGVDPAFTFRHVFLDPSQHGESLARDEARLLAKLRRAGAAADVAAEGDPFLLGHAFDQLPAREVKSQFGDRFAASLDSLPTGRWEGPILSGYGAHLVFVHERIAGRLPPFEEVKEAVRRAWAAAQREAAIEQLYATLLRRYTVTVEKPPPGMAADTSFADTAARKAPPPEMRD